MTQPHSLNDAGGTDWRSAYSSLMQTIMRNNPSARCYDVMGRRILPLADYHPSIPTWRRSFER